MKQRINTQAGYDLWAKWYDLEKNVLIYLDELYVEHREHSIQKLVANKTNALDVCCGSGRHLPVLEQHFEKVVGIDLSTQMLGVAKTKVNGNKTSLVPVDFLTYKPSEKFDFLNCSLALMHFSNLETFFRKAAGVLKKGGVLYLVDAPATFLKKGFTPHIHEQGKKIILEHIAHYQEDVRTVLQSSGFTLLSQTNLRLDPLLTAEIPEFSKFKDGDCLYVFVAKKVMA